MRKRAMHLTLFVLAALPALMAARGARAEEVWRCGATGASVRSYSDTPCAAPAQAARLLWLGDERSPEQVAAARRLAAREKALAERSRAEREAREAAWIAASSTPVALGTSNGVPVLSSPRKRAFSLKRSPRAPYADAGAETWPATAPWSPR
jgi:hypothetical protein